MKKWQLSLVLFFVFALPLGLIWKGSSENHERTARVQSQWLSRKPANFASQSCLDIIQDLSDISLSGSTRLVRRPFGLNTTQAATDGKHLQFGFESEYTLGELQGIVEVYGPKPEFGITKEQWFDMQVTERTEWVRENIHALFPETRVSGGLTKLSDDAEWEFLPDTLIFDDTGNVEIVLKPFDSFEEWYHSIQRLNNKFGNGSMQGTVSTPPDSFFGRGLEGIDPEVALQEKLGMFNFYSDYDIIQKLSAGAVRYQQDPSKQVAKNFDHPFLGPMTKPKQEILENLLKGNAIGEKYEADRLARIAGWENSFKYTGGTVYRPDILGEERVILEVRDAHKNFSLLTNRVLRSLFFMQHGTTGLDKLAGLRSFDPITDFQKLPKKVRVGLQELFPNKANPAYMNEYGPDQLFALDVFRNFSFPMREWDNHLQVLGAEEIGPQVKQAQDAYKDKLKKIFKARRHQEISDDEAKAQIEGALAIFTEDSGVAKAFEKYEDEVIFGERRGQQFADFAHQAQIEAGPIASSFPEQVWQGELDERVEFLANMYPNLVKKMDNVPFKFNGNEGRTRDVYIVSLKDVNNEERDAFFKDYFKAVSQNTISFPLNERAGHLYTRVGNKTYDAIHNLSESDYPMPSSKKLEGFMELEPDEFMRLRTYIDNAKQSKSQTIGGFSMGGAKGETAGQLDNNRPGKIVDGEFQPSGESHNCTSWICTAPIGDLGTDIRTLAGASPAYEIHTNPGWWSMWLLNYGKRDRVPFAFYFTKDESLEQAINKLSANGLKNWSFDAH